MKEIKLFLISDNKLSLVGLYSWLERHKNLVIIGSSTTDNGVVDFLSNFKTDVVILDTLSLRKSCKIIVKEIKNINSNIKFIALTDSCERVQYIRLIRSGYQGILTYNCGEDKMVEALSAVTDNETYFSPQITSKLKDGFMIISESESQQGLTTRELEILKYISEGFRNKNIAEYLCLSESTVKVHRKNLMDKLNIHSTALLTRFALKEKITYL